MSVEEPREPGAGPAKESGAAATTTLAYADVVAIHAALHAGERALPLGKAALARLRRLLAAQPHLAGKRGPGLGAADALALDRAHQLLAGLRAIVRRADEVQGLGTGPAASNDREKAPLLLPGIMIHKATGQDFVLLKQPKGPPRSVLLGGHGTPEAAQRYREVVAEHLAALFGGAPARGGVS